MPVTGSNTHIYMTQDNVNKITIRLLPDGYSFLNQYHPVQRGADFIQRLKESLLEEAERCETTEATRYVCSVESVRFCLSPLEEDIAPEACYRFCLSEAEQEETLVHLEDVAHGIRFSVGVDTELYHFLQRNFPELTFTHPLYELFTEWADKEEVKQNCMVAEADENFVNLLVFKEGRLQIANRFECTSTDDILYHVMNCWTQSALDVIEDKLYLDTPLPDITKNIGQFIKQCVS